MKRLHCGHVIALMFLLTACSKSAEDYLAEAKALQTANEPAKAEALLKEAVAAHPDNKDVSVRLLIFYLDAQQWAQARSYLSLAGETLAGGGRVAAYGLLGDQAWKTQDFGQAYDDYIMAGSLGRQLIKPDDAAYGCAMTGRMFGRATLAAVNAPAFEKFQTIRSGVDQLKSVPGCSGVKEVQQADMVITKAVDMFVHRR